VPKFMDLTGWRVGRLTVIRLAEHPRWECLCDCGRTTLVWGSSLRTAGTQSCGCLRNERISQASRTHGESLNRKVSPEFNTYYHAKGRCENPKNHKYPIYGGRGIQFKFTSLQQFIEVLGRRPGPEYSIDRINNNGHYEPGNVRWATRSQQMRNRRPYKLKPGRITRRLTKLV